MGGIETDTHEHLSGEGVSPHRPPSTSCGPGGRWSGRVVALAVASLPVVGCLAPSRVPFEVQRYTLDVHLQPAMNRLDGRAVMDLHLAPGAALPEKGAIAVQLRLHPDLRISEVYAGGATVRRYSVSRGSVRGAHGDGNQPAPALHTLILDHPVDALTLFVRYGGTLRQDVQAGEKEGEIHNLLMRAHVSPEGVYLVGGPWYPEPLPPAGAEAPLMNFTVRAARVPRIELVATGERDEAASTPTTIVWHSPYPMDGIALAGGVHDVHRLNHHGRRIEAHLKPRQSAQADGLLSCVAAYVDRYEPLIGPLPVRQFAVVDNFFSSGFAFPCFTLLNSAVIDMGERARNTHGYVDHELLHSWWGNGIFVEPSDGNWCEALASYGANYYGYVLDGNEVDARRQRRNQVHFLARLKPEDDKPLGTYGWEGGCGRGIAYSKGAHVFHMLARAIGQDTFWRAMRRFTAEYVGRRASWEDIRRVCEAEHGQPLNGFFEQWVRRSGAPTLRAETARYETASQTLHVALTQGDPPFALEVPIRVVSADGTHDFTIPLDTVSAVVTLPLAVPPRSVIVDPDYHIFRKIPEDDIIPTTARTRSGEKFTSIIPAGTPPEDYARTRDIFEGSFEEDERVRLTAGEVDPKALADRCVLVLGEAALDPTIRGFLEEINFPVRCTENGFTLNGVVHDDPKESVLCTARHPGLPGGGVTLLFAADPDALPTPGNIPFYDRSLVIFREGMAVQREDFEYLSEIPVTVE
jgi:hypothetical protein